MGKNRINLRKIAEIKRKTADFSEKYAKLGDF